MSSPVLWYATRASGLTALGLLTLAVVAGVLTTTRSATPRWPGVAIQDLHRRLSLTAAVFVVVHVLTSILDSFVHIGWVAVVVPFASGYKRWWVGLGAVSIDLFLAVVVTSLLRHRIGARTWRTVHWLTYGGWLAGVVHSIGIGTDMRLGLVRAVALGCAFVVVAAILARLAYGLAQRGRVATLPAVRHRAAGIGVKHRRLVRR
jgi:sulfoxide reductase heme-binding subunit YedZ